MGGGHGPPVESTRKVGRCTHTHPCAEHTVTVPLKYLSSFSQKTFLSDLAGKNDLEQHIYLMLLLVLIVIIDKNCILFLSDRTDLSMEKNPDVNVETGAGPFFSRLFVVLRVI